MQKDRAYSNNANFWYIRLPTDSMKVWLEEMGDEPERMGRFATALFQTAITGELVEVEKDIRAIYKLAAASVIAARSSYDAARKSGSENGKKGVEPSLETRRAQKETGLACGRPTSFEDFKSCAEYCQDGYREMDLPTVSDAKLRKYYNELKGDDWKIGGFQISTRDELVSSIRARFEPEIDEPEFCYRVVYTRLFKALHGKTSKDDQDEKYSLVGDAWRDFWESDGAYPFTQLTKSDIQHPGLREALIEEVKEFLENYRTG